MLAVDGVSHFSHIAFCAIFLIAMSDRYQVAFKSDGTKEEIEGEFAPSPMMLALMGSLQQMLARKDAEDAAARAATGEPSSGSVSQPAQGLAEGLEEGHQTIPFIAEGLEDDPIEDEEDKPDKAHASEAPASGSTSHKGIHGKQKKKSKRKGN